MALLYHGLIPRGLHSERDKSGLEDMTKTLTMIGSSERAQPDIAGRIKNLSFHFEMFQSHIVTLPTGVYIYSYF
jgi:truncated hemoglobin YjbI